MLAASHCPPALSFASPVVLVLCFLPYPCLSLLARPLVAYSSHPLSSPLRSLEL
ncbi:hypothetical protein BDQ12DRAFT_690765 [Crucibulum laeve]|uniref:Uncharacterized protein n=1 Tax=Crucibulum laeve TaxID=68775 RepID=A0A5C3LKR4_9AGAR|nr:hypothetical protein BDQ12DRAFT_690765 [Crucibulum laeve]